MKQGKGEAQMSSRVLVIDDDRDARVLWTAVAEAENLTVVEAIDGREAIETLKNDPDFVLVITDVMMPLADGYEVLKFIRDDERLKNLPVIISTSYRTTSTLSSMQLDV